MLGQTAPTLTRHARRCRGRRSELGVPVTLIRYLIPKEVRKTLVSLPGFRVAMGGGEHLLCDGSHSYLPLYNVVTDAIGRLQLDKRLLPKFK
ncbi:hypothetical protein EVAR_92042_1 [Eumeta japonica]|uniref:Uncharacterized protein n=1 Tax=Eumeta variegata TaxID=151549 RepID=A0A4C1T0V4_EUMVA|nr:hypothetical protein EVAR_92042_1 [Eumeta japonica]